MKKHKTTSFTKFLIFLGILAPLAFVGASLYQNKNPLTEFKTIVGIEQAKENKVPKIDLQKELKLKEKEIALLRTELNNCENNLRRCASKVVAEK